MKPASRRLTLVLACVATTASACSSDTEDLRPAAAALELESGARAEPSAITFAFAGDIHFEGSLASVPEDGRSSLGPMSEALRAADVAVVNLEAALTTRGSPTRKELEEPALRYWFRSPPSALEVLARSGVDVVSVANNHGADYGGKGLLETLQVAQSSTVAVVGAGRDHEEAYRAHRLSVRGTEVAVLAADASPRESADPVWAAGPGTGPGIASARPQESAQLLSAVRESAAAGELTVVYLHWGEEGEGCPTGEQAALAQALSDAGADVVVGSHAHLPLGAGVLGGTYVSYGLGNFAWYNGRESDTGVLRLEVRGDSVVGDEWLPATIPPAGGLPKPLTGTARRAALTDWRELRACTDLAPGPSAEPAPTVAPTTAPDPAPTPAGGDVDATAALPPFTSRVRPVAAAQQETMRAQQPATCPVPMDDLRLLELSYVGFDGRSHPGRMIVHVDVAADVVEVFAAMYSAGFPIERMKLVDEYAGSDNASMAANNTSGYNCRQVAGTNRWSDHAYGRAVDINPVQNPYVLGDGVLPPAGRRFVSADRTAGGRQAPGVIRAGDVVTRAFDRIGWTWGGTFAEPDYQHFSAP